ncbi:MAG: hypothetical protein KDA20_00695 [Phycisphaerales bacterium]|nr:hypothetical protein [Phycisphaerales bacterium]
MNIAPIVASLALCSANVEFPWALPRGALAQWQSVPVDERPILAEACTIEDDQLNQMLENGTAEERGLALFVLDQRGDIARLLELHALLDDARMSIPSSDVNGVHNTYAFKRQSIAGQLSNIYHAWFGVVPHDVAEFEALIGEADPDTFVTVWVWRLYRARTDSVYALHMPQYISSLDIPESAAIDSESVLEEVKQLPADLRWVVACAAYSLEVGTYDLDSKRAVLTTIIDKKLATELVVSAAEELGGKIDPRTSRAWEQPGLAKMRIRNNLYPGDLQRKALEALPQLAPPFGCASFDVDEFID